MAFLDNTGLSYLWSKITSRLNLKYDKAGGEITGNVKVDGTLTLDIEDEDYDSGITFSKSLDDNLGTVLTLNGYADNSSYKPVIRNISNPASDYDAANKRYVDSKILTPSSYLVALNTDGTIDTYSSNLTYTKVKSELTNYSTDVYLDVIYNTSRIHIPATQDQDTNSGPVVFAGPIRLGADNVVEAIFTLDSQNQLNVSYAQRENAQYKTSDITSNYNSIIHYPTTKGVWDTFRRKPVVVYSDDTGLSALQTDIAANMNWQLTGLDLTPFKRIKIYAKSGQGSTNAGTTGAAVLEMSLDSRMAIATKGGHYVGSMVMQKPNDANRLATLTCAVSSDKTSFAVLRQTSLYGTAATTNADIGASVVMIEGYYD